MEKDRHCLQQRTGHDTRNNEAGGAASQLVVLRQARPHPCHYL